MDNADCLVRRVRLDQPPGALVEQRVALAAEPVAIAGSKVAGSLSWKTT